MLRCPECTFVTVVRSLLSDHRCEWHDVCEDAE